MTYSFKLDWLSATELATLDALVDAVSELFGRLELRGGISRQAQGWRQLRASRPYIW